MYVYLIIYLYVIFLFVAGSKLEDAISEGPAALNAFISSGEIEELNDVIPHIENDYESDSSFIGEQQDKKRPRIDLTYDHNAQLVFDRDPNSQPSFIPPLMALNVHVDTNGPPDRPKDQDYRNPINSNGNTDRDERGIWQSNNGPMLNNQWAGGGGVGQSNNPFSGNNHNNKPPSLLNISIEPPDMSPGNNAKWGGDSNNRSRPDTNRSRSRDDKGRRRDSEGRRISRFDNNENRNRRTVTNESNGGSNSNRSGGGSNGSSSGSGRNRSSRTRRRN